MAEYMEANRRHWNEDVPIHAASDFYRERWSRLKPVELAELGPEVRGKTLLHLQCHFGLDTLAWAREGAIVTGVDFAPAAIEKARQLAAESGIDARFIESNVYDLPQNLDGQFDVVFTSYGALCWLPDLARWAKVAARYVKPGGVFYMVELHPVQQSLETTDDNAEVSELKLRWPYFPTGAPLRWEDQGTYADKSAPIENRVTYNFPYPLGTVVTSLIDAGLRIEFLHEFPFTTFKFLPFMEDADADTYRLTKGDGTIPLMFSIKARKPV